MQGLAATAQPHLSREELQQLKWLLGQVLAVIALWTLSFMEAAQSPILLLTIPAVAATLLNPRLPGLIPRWVWRVVTPVLILFVITDLTLHATSPIPALMRMVTLLVAYRCLQYRRTREDLQLVLLCLFMVVMSGVLTVSLAFAFQILIFTPTAMTLLFIVTLLDSSRQEVLSREDWQRFRWGRLLRRIRKVLDMRFVGIAAGLFAILTAISAVIFISMPRFQFEQAIPFLQLPAQPRSGFSEEIAFGEVTDIREDNSIALQVDVPSLEALPQRPYWRMLVLDAYQNGTFAMSDSLEDKNDRGRYDEDSLGLPRRLNELSPVGLGRRPRQADSTGPWTFYMEGAVSAYLPLLGPFNRLQFEGQRWLISYDPVLNYRMRQVQTAPLAYRIGRMEPAAELRASAYEIATFFGARPFFTAEEAEAAPKFPLTQLTVDLPAEDLAYMREVVEEVHAAAGFTPGSPGARMEPRAFSEALVAWLQEGRGYSLSSTAEGSGDMVCNWLRGGGPGHCELFAGAFTLAARTAGYPTRVVVGFAGGSWNTVQEFFAIRNRNAHAWVEVYDESQQTWFRVDPTPDAMLDAFGNSELAGGGDFGFGFESGFGAWMDSLRILWYRQVVNFDEQAQEDLLEATRETLKGFLSGFEEQWKGLKLWFMQPVDSRRVLVYAMVAGAALAVLLLYLLRDRWVPLLLGKRGALWLKKSRANPIRRRASRQLRRFKPAYDNLRQEVSAHREEPNRGNGKNGHPPDLGPWKRQYAELQALRFGPETDPHEAEKVFAKTKRLLRQG